MPPKPLPPGVPKSIKFGSVSFPVFATGDKRIGFRYKVGSKWKQAIRGNLPDLRQDAERIAISILNAETESLDISATDRRVFIAAREVATRLGYEVDAAMRLLDDAARAAGGIAHVLEACRGFKSCSDLTETADVVERFIQFTTADGASDVYMKPVKADLAKFAVQFQRPLAAIKTGEMEDWLRAMNVGARRRKNIRATLVTLFNFARDNVKCLPANARTEAELIRRPKIVRKAPTLYTPLELSKLIEQCAQPACRRKGRKDYEDFIPYIVIGAFAGLRPTEIQRMTWADVHWSDGVIAVGDENKTGYRQVPIEPNLMSWIAPFRDSVGPVCKTKRPDHAIASLRKRAGLPVGGRAYADAFRHSYVTYSVAVTKNMPLVSVHSGHSVAELKKSYLRASLESVGKEWFAITRDAGNVLQMPLLSLPKITRTA